MKVIMMMNYHEENAAMVSNIFIYLYKLYMDSN